MVMQFLDKDGDLQYQMLSPLDIFALNGWCPAMSKGDDETPLSVPISHPGYLKRSTFAHMAGNMWSAFHFAPILMAAMGSVDWAGCDPSLRDVGDDDDEDDAADDSDGDEEASDGSDGSAS